MIRVLLSLLRTTGRTGTAGLLGLALLMGLAGGAVLTGVETARRTDTAFDRLLVETEAWDMLVNPDIGTDSELDMAEVAALPGVANASQIDGVSIIPSRIESLTDLDAGATAFASDGSWGYEFTRPLVDHGRMPDPDAPDEILLSTAVADDLDLTVGDRYPVKLVSFEDYGVVEESGSPEAAVDAINDPDFGRIVELEVVGIGTWFDDIVVDEAFQGGSILLTPTFYDQYDQPSAGYWGGIIRFEPGADRQAFRDQVEAMVPEEAIAFQGREGVEDQFARAVDPQVGALLIFTVVAALVSLVIVGQAISRRLAQDAAAFASLGALGVTRRQRVALGLARIALAALVGGALAVVIAVLASPVGPVGVARSAEPDPGLRLDPIVLVAGGLAVVLVALLLALWPTVAATRRAAPVDARRGVGSWAASLGLRPALVTGLRFALDRGAAGVPARATLIGAVSSVALVVATVAFSASLTHLVDHPDLYGTPFNAVFDVEGVDDPGPEDYDPLLAALEDRDNVTAFGLLHPGQLSVDGRSVAAMAIDPSSRSVEPTVLEGRAPVGDREIAVGSRTLDDLGVEIGDPVTLDRADETHQVTVTGIVVLPAIGAYSGADKTTLGEGVLADSAVLEAWGPRFTPTGVIAQVEGLDDPQAMAEALELPEPLIGSGRDALTPSDIQSLERVRSTPLVLTALLAALIALTVIHALIAAVRSRRRELAVLRSVGFTRGQVLRCVAVQALVIAAIGVLVGLPVGVALGRVAWTEVADRLGAVVELTTPLLAFGAVALGVAAVALLAGLWPGLRAARAHPAAILRTE